MSYEQTVAPSVNAISLTEAKEHLRIDTTDEDTILGVYIDASEDYAEQKTNIQHITATWVLRLDKFPDSSSTAIVFTRNPIQSIASITYIDTDGVSQTWASSKYEVDIYSQPGSVKPINTEAYPSTKEQFNAVTITFDAGYGDATTDVPDERRSMLLLMTAYLYENRDATQSMNGESVAVAWPAAVETLLQLGSLKNVF